MAATLLTAFVLGLFAGLAPGPYTTMVAGTALERGFRAGFVLALTPLFTDVVPMLFSALLLEQMGWAALTILGIGGGAVIVVVGIRFLRHHSGENEESREVKIEARPHFSERRQSAGVIHVVLSTILNPSPWVFWLMVASPLLLRSWNRSRAEGVLFVAVIFLTNITTASALAWVASRGRKALKPAWRRRALQGVGTALIAAGAFLLWQAAMGNFQGLIDGQAVIRSVLEESTSSM